MTHSIRYIASLALLCAAPTSVLAQTSGFQPGELIYYSQALPNLTATGGGIVRIDPMTGVASLLFDVWTADSRRDNLAYDAYRDRVLFYGGFPAFADPSRLYLLDGHGNTTVLGAEERNVQCIAPGSGGRIYYLDGLSAEIGYFDADDQPHLLMDVGGAQPFVGTGIDVDAMVFDAATNSLFVAARLSNQWCLPQTSDTSIIKIPLSNDSSRLRAPYECIDVVVDPTTGSAPVGMSHTPDGKLLVFILTNSSGALPRMSLIDPLTLEVTTFSTNGSNGSRFLHAGTWSHALGRAVIVDDAHNDLRSFAFGQNDDGTIITTSIPLSNVGAGAGICIIEIGDGNGTVVNSYCEPKVTADSCVPAIRGTGLAQHGAQSGFLIEATEVPPNRLGLFFYGIRGPAAIPFLGGTKCMRFSPQRTRTTNSGGSGTCGGVLSMDFNTYMNSGANPLLAPGTVVWGQFWFRDQAHPVGGAGLSDALTFTILP